MKTIKYAAAALIILMIPFINVRGSYGAGMSKTAHGIKAVLKADPEKSPEKTMIDLYLYDVSRALTPMTDAKVRALVTLPDGTKVEKELIGMKMGGAFSFMNTLDMSKKGRYIFDIRLEAGKRTAGFTFDFEKRQAN